MEKENKVYGFINESGTYGFSYNTEEDSKYFLVTCIIVEKNKLYEVSTKAKLIIDSFLEKEEILDDNKRKILLNKVLGLDIEVFVFKVDKERISQEYNIRDRESFFKFLNGALYTDLVNTFPHMNLINDSLEEKLFISNFEKYLVETHSPDLLEEQDIVFINERNDYLLYVSSMINEIIHLKYANCYGEELNGCYELIKEKMLPMALWPRKADEYLENLNIYIREPYDETIAYNSIRIAFDFIINNGGTNNESKYAQVTTLKYLLNVLLNYGENRYICAQEVRNHLKKSIGKNYNNHYFQARIIAPLRDNGVLIATSQKGYKLPIKESEILIFINQSSSVIWPMVERVKICRDSILRATNNAIDVLDNDEYKYLKKLIDSKNQL